MAMGRRGSVEKMVYLLLLLVSLSWYADGRDCHSSCGNIRNITSPFRIQSDPGDCGESQFQLTCENNQTTLDLNQHKFLVRDIDYEQQTIRVAALGQAGDPCSYLQLGPEYIDDFSGSMYMQEEDYINFLKCLDPVNDPGYVAIAPCSNTSNTSASGAEYFYARLGWISVGDLHTNCNVIGIVPMDHGYFQDTHNLTLKGVQELLQYGFFLYYQYFHASFPFCHSIRCRILSFLRVAVEALLNKFMASIQNIGYVILGRTSFGMLCLAIFLIYKLHRKHLDMDDKIEEFLRDYKNHMPTRYSYWNVWRMTNRFKEKLGQGGFGSVYKGKCPNGRLIAAKMLLGKAKGEDGRDFINEVATIGRVHHVNVVQLIGFCSEGSKRALIYEFMPNGSLDKYINNRLSWEKMYEVALGIARGIKYLHHDCDMKILHFDIKPHNILLDENFNPKVSDFGLAKFYPVEDSHISVSAIRGTIGYIAPELFYKRAGIVSYKSDVYSYGMLLMDLTGRRTNVNPHAKSSSQIYFPSWIYEQLVGGGDMGIADGTNEEKSIARKLIIVALWCIQMKPTDRPSMSRVVEMLEGNVEHLEMPLKPFLSSQRQDLNEDDDIHLDSVETSSGSFKYSLQVSGEDQTIQIDSQRVSISD